MVQGTSESVELLGLIEETREALALLRAEDLERLADRAAGLADGGAAMPAVRGEAMRRLVAGHRGLGDLLRETERNLAVLRRLRGGGDEGKDGVRWVR